MRTQKIKFVRRLNPEPSVNEIADFIRILDVARRAEVLYFRTEFAGTRLKVTEVRPSATGSAIVIKVDHYRDPFLLGPHRVTRETFFGVVDGKPSFDFIPSWVKGGQV